MTRHTSPAAVGFIGLGAIGRPMARRILTARSQLMVWNRSASRMQPLLEQGAQAAASPADMARHCDILCTCVTDAGALEAVLFGPEGVARAGDGIRARLLVDNSTTHPRLTRDFAARLHAACGMRWLDVPVSGGVTGARAATLAAMAGGDAADVELARPVILSYAARLTHMGALGAGQATKACNQLINFVGFAAVAEAIHLGEGFGIDVQRLPQALADGFADTPILREYARGKAAGEIRGISALIDALRTALDGRTGDSTHELLHILLKDMAIVSDLGRGTGRAIPVFDLVEAQYRAIDAHASGSARERQ